MRVRFPASSAARAPVAVVSHGLGASRDDYAYLGRALAHAGWLVVHPRHARSDSDALRRLAREARLAAGPDHEPFARVVAHVVHDRALLCERPQDVRFVLDRLASAPPFAERADFSRVAVLGHSLGAFTALAVAGLKSRLCGTTCDERVTHVVAFSPQGSGTMGLGPDAWDDIRCPVLLVTGTRDGSIGGRDYTWRREPFERLVRADRSLLVVEGATHESFSDVPRGPRLRQGEAIHALVARAAVSFLRDGTVAADPSDGLAFTFESLRATEK